MVQDIWSMHALMVLSDLIMIILFIWRLLMAQLICMYFYVDDIWIAAKQKSEIAKLKA